MVCSVEDCGKMNDSVGIDIPIIMDEVQAIHDDSEFDQNAGTFFEECSPLFNDDQQQIFTQSRSELTITKEVCTTLTLQMVQTKHSW